MDGGKADMNKIRQKHQNSMHCVASILSNRTSRRLAIVWSSIRNILATLHGCAIIKLGSQDGNLEWYSAMAGGAWHLHLRPFIDLWADRLLDELEAPTVPGGPVPHLAVPP